MGAVALPPPVSGSPPRVVRVTESPAALADAAAEWLVAELSRALAARGRASVALSGGETPRLLFERLALPPFREWPGWEKLAVYWVDERAVPPDHAASNCRMADDALFSKLLAKPARHRMRGEAGDLAAEAARYAQLLEEWREGDVLRLDVVLLGLGADGHTASLFPGSPALAERTAWVVPALAPVPPEKRLTVTLPVLDAARGAAFLAAGESKREAVRRVFAPAGSAAATPARAVRPEAETIWFLDRQAAGELAG